MIADRDWGLTADGTVVEQADARCVRVLAGKGCFMPDDVARRHGLLGDGDGAVPVVERDAAAAHATEDHTAGKSLARPPRTKHLRGPRETKYDR